MLHCKIVSSSKKLPFRSPDGSSWWAVDPRGGYVGGCRSGKSAARAYLKFLRERRAAGSRSSGGFLQLIALDMMRSFAMAPPKGLSRVEAEGARKGHVVGFFEALCNLLEEMSPLMGGLDAVSFQRLADEMRTAGEWDEAKCLADARSQSAKVGGQTRRKRQRAAA